MKRLVVLGAGTAGTTIVNKLHGHLPDEWTITIVDQDNTHTYQPGYLFIPFGEYRPDQVVAPRARFIPKDVDFRVATIDRVIPEENRVRFGDGVELIYDALVVATGTTPRPSETEGMLGAEWRHSVHEFYTLEGAEALRQAIESFDGGRLVVHIAEEPIKCPVAPLEFAFLAEARFRERGIRDRVEITFVTPLDGAFTRPVAARTLGGLLEERHIGLEADFVIERVDNEAKTIVSFDERVIPFDLLVTVPVNMGADFIARSGFGDDLNYVRVDKGTFVSRDWPNLFAIGDAANLPTSKAGATAHFAADVFAHNFIEFANGRPMTEQFDGHANCFIELGDGKALLIDFNYDTEPLPGKYPLPVVGPLTLLHPSTFNHWGKRAFKWVYWNLLLRGRPLPVPTHMSMSGKQRAPRG